MEEKHVAKEFKLSNSVIRGAHSLLTFESGNAYTDVGCCDHIHIIGSVTDRQSRFVGVASTHHPDDLGLLFGADAAGEDNIGAFAQVDKFFD